MSTRPRRKNLAIRTCPYCEARISIRKRECEFCGSLLRKRKNAVFGESAPAQGKKKQLAPNSAKSSPPSASTSIDEAMSSQSLGLVSPPSSDDSSSNPPPTTPPPQNNEPHSPNEPQQHTPPLFASSPTPTRESELNEPTSNASVTATTEAVMTSSTHPSSLPDFMTALNMAPTTSVASRKEANNGIHVERGSRDNKIPGGQNGSQGNEVQDGAKDEEKMDVESSSPLSVKESLTEKFKRDPNEVLRLLQSALSMDKLSSLISEAYQSDKEQVQQLQTRLEAAYHILKDCTEQKESLTKKIDETGETIKSKRKHLESLREELQALGEEEIHIKRRRDVAFERYSELKRKLRSSRDALHQISLLAPSYPPKIEHAQLKSKETTSASTNVTTTGPPDGGGSGIPLDKEGVGSSNGGNTVGSTLS